MAALASWALVVYGVTLVLTGSRAAAPLRRLVVAWVPRAVHFVTCPMCVGWWVGLAAALLEPRLGPLADLELRWWARDLGAAFAASAVCWALHVLLVRLGAEKL